MPGTRVLAWYGAVVATISLGWGIYWAVYTRRREPEQHVRVRKHLRRADRIEQWSRDLVPEFVPVIEMCRNMCLTYRDGEALDPRSVRNKVLGRLQQLETKWKEAEEDLGLIPSPWWNTRQ